MTYLDHNATTPLAKGLADFVRPYLETEFGNPSSISYELGRTAREAIEKARKEVADLIDADPQEIVFTSGGTESINLAILGSLLSGQLKEGACIYRSSVEHPAVKQSFDLCKNLLKVKEKIVAVSKEGFLIYPEDLKSSEVKLFSVMLANNETGIIHDLRALKEKISPSSLLHVDATQAIGKIPFSFRELNIDFCSFSAHKFGGPKGIGALVIKGGTDWSSPMSGGGQEQGRRGGTENVPLIVGLGYSAKIAKEKLIQNYSDKLKELRDYFEAKVLGAISHIEIIGANSPRLPNTSNLLIPGIVGSDLVSYLGSRGICISAGSACKASSFSASPVLIAMGYSSLSAVSAIRVSFGEGNQVADADLFINEVVKYYNTRNKLEDLLSEGK